MLLKLPVTLPAIISITLLCKLGAYIPQSVPKITTINIQITINFSCIKYLAIRLTVVLIFFAYCTSTKR